MITPKVGEVWISSSNTEHLVKVVTNEYLITEYSGNSKAENVWKKYESYYTHIMDVRCLLEHKKKKKITLYMGWTRTNLGDYISSTFQCKEERDSFNIKWFHTAEVEFEVDDE